MLISKSNLALSASHDLDSKTVRQVRLAEQPRADEAFAKLLDARTQPTPTQLLTVDTAAGQLDAGKADKKNPFDMILQMLFGLTPMAASLPQTEGTGPRSLQALELVHTSETESCDFSASGNVCLADGSTRQFDVSYHMERSSETDSARAVSMHDPLMLDSAQPSNGLGKNVVDFDLDGDGKTERMRMPANGTAVLFDDINHNGKADDGSELFGPTSGDGFADLAKLDSDGNGWIDSGDAAFADLKLWSMNDDGTNRVQSLADAGVGALSTQNAKTPFTLKQDGETVGQVRASGVWLGENGGAGVIRQVDVATEPSETQPA